MDDLIIPKIGDYLRGSGRLIKVEVIPPKPVEPRVDYIFEDIESRCELRHHGKSIKHIETLSDFYGIGTGEKTAIENMEHYA